MTTPSGDDAPPKPAHAEPSSGASRPPSPDGSEAPSGSTAPGSPGTPSSPGAQSGPAAPWAPAEAVGTPKPPQAWFAPPQMPPASTAGDEPAAGGVASGRFVHACLIGAAAIVLVSAFLPWASWSVAVLRGAQYIGLPDQVAGGHVVYGMSGNDGMIVVLAGMAALALAVAAQAVSDRFAPYAAIPGGLALIAIFHDGVTLGDGDITVARTISWGYWVAAVAALAVVVFGLAAAARTRPQS